MDSVNASQTSVGTPRGAEFRPFSVWINPPYTQPLENPGPTPETRPHDSPIFHGLKLEGVPLLQVSPRHRLETGFYPIEVDILTRNGCLIEALRYGA